MLLPVISTWNVKKNVVNWNDFANEIDALSFKSIYFNLFNLLCKVRKWAFLLLCNKRFFGAAKQFNWKSKWHASHDLFCYLFCLLVSDFNFQLFSRSLCFCKGVQCERFAFSKVFITGGDWGFSDKWSNMAEKIKRKLRNIYLWSSYDQSEIIGSLWFWGDLIYGMSPIQKNCKMFLMKVPLTIRWWRKI